MAQRARAFQAGGGAGRDRLHRAVQRVRLLRSPRWPAADLRPARAGRHPGVLRPVDVTHPAAADRRRPGGRVLVGTVAAASRGIPDHRVRRATAGPGVLRGAHRRQPGPGPPGERRGAVQTRPAGPQAQRPGRRQGVQDRDRPPLRWRDHQRLLAPFPGETVPEGGPRAADRDRGELAR